MITTLIPFLPAPGDENLSSQSFSHLKKAQDFYPKQGKKLRLKQKRQKLQFQANFPDQTEEGQKGIEVWWVGGWELSLFLKFEEGGP